MLPFGQFSQKPLPLPVLMFGITNPDVIANSLGKPSIDLDRGTLTYLEHTMDSLHIIEMEFDGIFTAFYNSCIDG